MVRDVGTSVGPSKVVRDLAEDVEDATEAVGVLRDFLSMSKSIHKPVVIKFVVRDVGTSVGPSEVVRELTEDVEDGTEDVEVLRDFLSMSKSIHKPDSEDIDGYEFS